jgi:hypothetical protein
MAKRGKDDMGWVEVYTNVAGYHPNLALLQEATLQ